MAWMDMLAKNINTEYTQGITREHTCHVEL